MVPQGLRNWFVIHFVADMLFGLPLLIAPASVLPLFGWQTVDPFTARLVGAALMGIGIESFLGRNAGLEAYQGMLNLKIIWSATAILGMGVTMIGGAGPSLGWLFVGIFLVFDVVWVYYRLRLR